MLGKRQGAGAPEHRGMLVKIKVTSSGKEDGFEE